MRKVLIASFIFFLLFGYGLILSQFNVSVVPEELKPANYPGFYDYRGVTNVHTTRGIGSGTPAEVIRAAQEAGLDFIFLTDLNLFGGTTVSDGYHRQLLVLTANEYSYLEARLLLYDRQKRHSLDSLGQAQVVLADLLSQSGPDADPDILVLAHPTKQGFSWSGPYPSGLDAIEIVNLKSVWQRAWMNTKFSFFWSAIVYPFNQQLALLRLYDESFDELALWDQLNQKGRVYGMAGSEATARTGSSFGKLSLKFPAYQTSFSLLSNHVVLRSELTGDVEGDRKKILDAIAGGQFYVSLDVLGDPKGFAAFIQDGEKVHPMGARVKYVPGMRLKVHLPRRPKTPFETKFIKDGQELMASNSVDSDYEIHGPGVYRVIARVFPTLTLPDGQRWITWIYSNPFYVE